MRAGLVTVALLAAVAVAVPPAAGATGGAAPAGAASAVVAAGLTKERLYELARQRSYGTPVAVDLPGDEPWASLITDSGVVVGSTTIDGVAHLFRWRDGQTDVLPMPVEGYTGVNGVNDAGQVLFSVAVGGGAYDPSVWEPDGTVTSLADAGPWREVGGLNAHGVVYGTSESWQPRTWSDGVVTPLEVPGGHPVLIPRTHGINDRGDVVATVLQPDAMRPYVWRDGVPTELPLTRGASGVVRRVNDSGDVLGDVSGASIDGLVVWEDGRRLRFADKRDRYGIFPYDMNEKGVVVGVAESRSVKRGPVRSNERGIAAPLPGLGRNGGEAHAVHDLDIAVGLVPGAAPDAPEQPVMWVLTVPVPLGTRLDGVQATGGWATDINRGGQVLGRLFFRTDDPWRQRAEVVLWDLDPRR